MKCINCGVDNLNGTERCKNCEYPFKKKIEFYEKPDKAKNFILIFTFNILFCFIIPVALLQNFLNTRSSFTLTLSFTLLSFLFSILFHIFGELLTCIIVKKIVNNSYNFKKIFIYYELFALAFYLLLIIFRCNDLYWILVILALFKILSYFLTVKIGLKEKINFKKVYLIPCFLYLFVLFLMPNLLMPTTINKTLFKIFGSSEFSSKNLQIELIEKWNEDKLSDETYVKDVTYFHKFTDEELESITKMSIKDNFNDNDLAKFQNLITLNIENVKTKSFYDFSKNDNLKNVSIKNSEFKNLSSSSLNNVIKLTISNSNFDDIYIGKNGELKELYIEESKLNNIDIKNNKTLALIEAENLKLNNVTISNNSNLTNVAIRKSNIKKVLIDNNPSLISVTFSKVNTIEIKNMVSLETFFENYKDDYNEYNEYIMFKNFIYEDKKISFNNNEYIAFDGALYVKKNSLVKDLLLENLTAKVYDIYHDIISCDSDSCIYNEEEKKKEQGLESILSDELQLYDGSKLILDCRISDLKDFYKE